MKEWKYDCLSEEDFKKAREALIKANVRGPFMIIYYE
jgi:hypothetical protein